MHVISGIKFLPGVFSVIVWKQLKPKYQATLRSNIVYTNYVTVTSFSRDSQRMSGMKFSTECISGIFVLQMLTKWHLFITDLSSSRCVCMYVCMCISDIFNCFVSVSWTLRWVVFAFCTQGLIDHLYWLSYMTPQPANICKNAVALHCVNLLCK